MQSTSVIPIFGYTQEAKESKVKNYLGIDTTLHAALKAHPNIRKIISTASTTENGKYLLLIDRHLKDDVEIFVDELFNQLPEMKKYPANFKKPQRGGNAFKQARISKISNYLDKLLDEVLRQIQESLTAWEGGIHATGGAIEPLKSHWYLIDYHWVNGKPIYKSIEEAGRSLKVRDPRGEIGTLKQLQPWQAEQTLGVRIAPYGNMESQFQWMMDTARTWADKLRTGYLPRHLTWLAWRTTILKTLEYPLPTTSLS
jgi:hypothetical protein